jgi:hypothetical protein
MNKKIKNIISGNLRFSFLLSVLIHLILFLSAAYFFSSKFNKPVINIVQLDFLKSELNKEENLIDKKDESEFNEEIKPPENKEQVTTGLYYHNLTEAEFDTSNLKQIYSESTLNVTLRYPNGWTYIDQNVKNKLDGVTFWSLKGNYPKDPADDPPPYVHLEVKEKYLFNPSRFKYKTRINGNDVFYNDPEELEGQVSQIVYIRTGSDEDYSLKLIMKGKEAFKSFQPEFFNMIKSFKFGSSFF